MSNLSNRVKKAKELTWSHSPRNPSHYGTWGIEGEYYNVDLGHKVESVHTDYGQIPTTVIEVTCKVDLGGGTCSCLGNNQHTVCYHGLGAIYESFRKNGKLVSFFEDYEDRFPLFHFGGCIVLIKSAQGKGFVWAMIGDWPCNKSKLSGILPAKENIQLMRGSEDDEGID